MKRRLSRSIAVRIAELRRLIAYWPKAREQIEIEIAFWRAR